MTTTTARTRREPTQQRSRRTVRQILDAAEEIVGIQGVDAATTRLPPNAPVLAGAAAMLGDLRLTDGTGPFDRYEDHHEDDPRTAPQPAPPTPRWPSAAPGRSRSSTITSRITSAMTGNGR